VIQNNALKYFPKMNRVCNQLKYLQDQSMLQRQAELVAQDVPYEEEYADEVYYDAEEQEDIAMEEVQDEGHQIADSGAPVTEPDQNQNLTVDEPIINQWEDQEYEEQEYYYDADSKVHEDYYGEDKPAEMEHTADQEIAKAANEAANMAAEASKNVLKGITNIGGGLMSSFGSTQQNASSQKKEQDSNVGSGIMGGLFGGGKKDQKKEEKGFGFGGFGFGLSTKKTSESKSSGFGFGKMLDNLESALDLQPDKHQQVTKPQTEILQQPESVIPMVEETPAEPVYQDDNQYLAEISDQVDFENNQEEFYGEQIQEHDEVPYGEVEMVDNQEYLEREVVEVPQDLELEREAEKVHEDLELTEIPQAEHSQKSDDYEMKEVTPEETIQLKEDVEAVANNVEPDEIAPPTEEIQAQDTLRLSRKTTHLSPRERWWWAVGMIYKVERRNANLKFSLVLFSNYSCIAFYSRIKSNTVFANEYAS
jgi:hypothetical protein